MNDPNPAITTVRAEHDGAVLSFEPVTQDRRLYYCLLSNGRRSGSLTDERHALLTIQYWREQGWILIDMTP